MSGWRNDSGRFIPGKKFGTHCTGGWVRTHGRAGQVRKTCPYLGSNPRLSNPKRVAILTTLRDSYNVLAENILLQIVTYFYFPVFNKFINLANLIASPSVEAKLLWNLMLRNILYRTLSRGVGQGKEECQIQRGMLQESVGDVNSIKEDGI